MTNLNDKFPIVFNKNKTIERIDEVINKEYNDPGTKQYKALVKRMRNKVFLFLGLYDIKDFNQVGFQISITRDDLTESAFIFCIEYKNDISIFVYCNADNNFDRCEISFLRKNKPFEHLVSIGYKKCLTKNIYECIFEELSNLENKKERKIK